METITSLGTIEADELYRSFSLAFADYEMQVNKREFLAMISRRGYKAELSFGAFVDGRLVAFTLNGTGKHGNVETAYDTGTGTIEGFRGRGLAGRIFEHSLPCLHDAGIRQYLLEVLQHNDKAVKVYRRLGFEVTREFNYFSQKIADLHFSGKGPGVPIEIRPVSLKDQRTMENFLDFEPSWQNSFASIRRRPADFTMIGAFTAGNLCGHCIFDPSTGDITQLAIHPEFRRLGIGTALFKLAVSFIWHHSVKVINTDATCPGMEPFLASHGIPLSGKQFEMAREV